MQLERVCMHPPGLVNLSCNLLKHLSNSSKNYTQLNYIKYLVLQLTEIYAQLPTFKETNSSLERYDTSVKLNSNKSK